MSPHPCGTSRRRIPKLLGNDSSRPTEKPCANNSDLSEDVVSHIRPVQARTPKEQVTEIERACRAIGYYDTKNEETLPTKQGKTLNDKFF